MLLIAFYLNDEKPFLRFILAPAKVMSAVNFCLLLSTSTLVSSVKGRSKSVDF